MAMNIIQLQDNLKNLSDQQLAQAMQMPAQDTPPFLVLTELNRRKQMRDNFQAQQADQNKTTVAQDAVAAVGVPQQFASGMAQSLAPQTDTANNTGIMSIPQGEEPQRMAGGGPVKKMFAGQTPPEVDRTSFTLGDILADYGITFGLDGTSPYAAVPGPGRTPVPAVTPTTVPPVAPGTPIDLAQLAEVAAADRAAADQAAAEDTPAGGGGGGGGGGGKPSSYEQALRDAMAASEKKAKQDKWLALAQMGMSLLSSAQPNVGMALGEAGAKGIEALQGARDTASEEKLRLEEGLYKLEQSRAAAAAAAARANAPGKPKPIDASALSALDARIKAQAELVANLPDGAAKLQAANQLNQLTAQADYLFSAYMTQRGAGEGLASIPVNTEDPADTIDATQ